MKKVLLAIAAATMITSCSQNDDEVISNGNPLEIQLNAGIETAVSRAAVNKGDALQNIQIVKSNGTADWSSVTSITTTGDMAAGGAITLSAKQYYPSDGANTNILGFYPAATSITGGIANMTIDGTQDVLYATPVSGSKGTPVTEKLSFQHKLTQFKFVAKRDATSTDADITEVKVMVKDANSVFKMALTDGALSGWATTISTITPITNGTAAETESTPSEGIMLEPELAKLVLLVSAKGYDEQEITINGTDAGKFAMGKAYTITLTFKGTEIAPTGEIAEWTTGTAGGVDIN